MNIFVKIVVFCLALTLANLPYKKEKNFSNISWRKTIYLSGLFLFSLTLLVYICYSDAVISYNFGYIFVLMLTLVFWLLTPLFVRRYGSFPATYLDKSGNESRFMARLEYKSMTVKLFEVLLQEASFLYLYFSILKGLGFYEKGIVFIAVVVVIHLANLLFMNARWAFFYTLLSIPMAIIFSVMMNNGQFFLTLSIHLAFYIFFNARYWFIQNPKSAPPA